MQAMNKEYENLLKNNTWKLVDKPKNANVIGSKWIFTKKVDNDSSIKFKARLVAQGCSRKTLYDQIDISDGSTI